MAETLSSILLVTTSANESSLVCCWPPNPISLPRFSRAPPSEHVLPTQMDNPWKTSHFADLSTETNLPPPPIENDVEYQWRRPEHQRDRSVSFSHSSSRPPSGRNSPTLNDGPFSPADDEYDHLYGYSSKFLANLLCPHSSMCHQKFVLVVDDLAFIGHPVCSQHGVWKFEHEKGDVTYGRGRESRSGRVSSQQRSTAVSASPVRPSPLSEKDPGSWLHTFHLVFVLDLPDPSSSASGNVSKYFEIVYEQMAFPVTAVLYQEQVLSGFIQSQCETLGSLKESCISKGEPFSSFVAQALETSSIVSAMKALFEAIKTSSMAQLTINNLSLELQLPPYLDLLLHTTTENELDFLNHPDDDEVQAWGPDMTIGWRLPILAPWKSLLLLDAQGDLNAYMNLQDIDFASEDRVVVEGLIRFLEIASITLSVADMASLLDWDLESQVYPTVRWLVQHRRAKVVDIVHPSLKTVFTLSPEFDLPMAQLAEEFQKNFDHPAVTPLPQILATISTAVSKQSDNHFFASVVKSKDLIPIYHDVISWMLKRDLLVTLHLRVRIVATRDLKLRVRLAKERWLAKKAGGTKHRGRRGLRQELEAEDVNSSGIAWLSLSPKSARNYTRRVSSNGSAGSKLSGLLFSGSEKDINEEEEEDDEDDYEEFESDDMSGVGWDSVEDNLWPTLISDPSRATALQRKWLTAMSRGKESHVARRFELINQYFDGKKTDDEILYRAEITRRELREVLHHYEEYLQTYLHPS